MVVCGKGALQGLCLQEYLFTISFFLTLTEMFMLAGMFCVSLSYKDALVSI